MKPEGEEAKILEEIVAKRQKKGKRVDDDKPLEEKSILHSKCFNCHFVPPSLGQTCPGILNI